MQVLCMVRGFVLSGNSILEFFFAELVVCVNKNRHNSIKCFNATVKATASAREPRYVMPKVCVDAFYIVRVFFVADIAYMTSGKNDVQITEIAVSTVFFSIWRRIHNLLYPLRGFIAGGFKTNDLARFSAYHGHQIYIFTRLGTGFALYKPIQFVQFKSVVGFSTCLRLIARFFLSSCRRSPCSYQILCLRLVR